MITDLMFHNNIIAMKYAKNPIIATFKLMPYVYKALFFFFKRKVHEYIVNIHEPDILLYDFLKFVDISGYKYKFQDEFVIKGLFIDKDGAKVLSSVLCRMRTENNNTIEIHFLFSTGMYMYKVLNGSIVLNCMSSTTLDNNIFNNIKNIIYKETLRIYKIHIIDI